MSPLLFRRFLLGGALTFLACLVIGTATASAAPLNTIPTPSSDTTPTFSGDATAANGDVTVTIYNGSGTAGSVEQVLTATPDGLDQYSINAAPLADAVYTVEAVQNAAPLGSQLSLIHI